MKSLGTLAYEDPRDRLVLTEAETRELSAIESKMAVLRGEKLIRLRKIAWAKGIAAKKLKDLKSRSGEPFVSQGKTSYDDCKRAIAKGRGGGFEYAYFCATGFTNRIGCGWVKGVPDSRNYNNIGPLSGSAGEKSYCKICGMQIGKRQDKIS